MSIALWHENMPAMNGYGHSKSFIFYLHIHWRASMHQGPHEISIVRQSFINVVISINNECVTCWGVATLFDRRCIFDHNSFWWLDYLHCELRLKFISNPILFRNWVKVDITKSQYWFWSWVKEKSLSWLQHSRTDICISADSYPNSSGYHLQNQAL